MKNPYRHAHSCTLKKGPRENDYRHRNSYGMWNTINNPYHSILRTDCKFMTMFNQLKHNL